MFNAMVRRQSRLAINEYHLTDSLDSGESLSAAERSVQRDGMLTVQLTNDQASSNRFQTLEIVSPQPRDPLTLQPKDPFHAMVCCQSKLASS
jgi:hypothetical protein